jgi:hypothetical protein
MNETANIPALLPALPVILLAVGAMVLLMMGAFRSERAPADTINWLAIVRSSSREPSSSGCRRASS